MGPNLTCGKVRFRRKPDIAVPQENTYHRCRFGLCQCLSTTAQLSIEWAAILRMPASGASALSEGASDHRMADYQPLLTRAVANLPSTSTVATRHAIYERARKAQLAQLGTLRPPLPESDIAREEEALDQAIALVEAKFGGTDFTSREPPFAATTPAAATQQASAGSAPADAARTEASIPPLSNLTKVVPPGARAEKQQVVALTCARRCARRCSGGCVRRDRDASETTIPRRGSARSAAGVAPAGRFSLPAAARVALADGGQFNRASRKRAAGKSTDRAKRIGAGQSGAGCKQPPATGNGPSRDADRLR